jgi:hypothetical protein
MIYIYEGGIADFEKEDKCKICKGTKKFSLNVHDGKVISYVEEHEINNNLEVMDCICTKPSKNKSSVIQINQVNPIQIDELLADTVEKEVDDDDFLKTIFSSIENVEESLNKLESKKNSLDRRLALVRGIFKQLNKCIEDNGDKICENIVQISDKEYKSGDYAKKKKKILIQDEIELKLNALIKDIERY